MISFDYPLNEKARNYLRFEFLFTEVKKSVDFPSSTDATLFFKSLFDLIELTERTDIRQDLVKDLRLQLEQLKIWLKYDQVDQGAILAMIDEVESLVEALMSMPKVSRYFKSNRFLSSLKQRFCIPSGTCNFDLPQYHFWLNHDEAKQQADAKLWLSQFVSLEDALSLFLKLKRSQSKETTQIAENGFYQGNIECADFITLKIAKALSVYPMISGHKNRYSTRFMSAEFENRLPENIEFIEIAY